MRPIPLNKIVVPEHRQRTSMDDGRVKELQDSFRSVGQLQPICVENQADGTFRLIIGERRFRAKSGMPSDVIRCGDTGLDPGEIMATFWDELSEIQRYEMELEENIRRVDLSWQDQCQAITRLNSLRQVQAKKTGEFYGARQLAEEANLAPEAAPPSTKAAAANVMLTVAKHLDDPEIAGAKSLKEAQKLVDKKVKRQQLGVLAASFEREAAKSCPHRLLRGDCFDLMAAIPDASFDLILSDPPYGIEADKFGDMASTGHKYEDDADIFEKLCWRFPDHCFRLLKSQGHVYIFCDFSRFEDLKVGFEVAGFDVWPRPLIWNKSNGMLPKPTLGPRYTFECILFANKGQRHVEVIASDVLSVPLVPSPRHGAEKPVGVYRDLMGRSTRPGDTVLDPFCGSGTIFPAATLSKLQATGMEKLEEYANLAASRLMEGMGQQQSILEAF